MKHALCGTKLGTNWSKIVKTNKKDGIRFDGSFCCKPQRKEKQIRLIFKLRIIQGRKPSTQSMWKQGGKPIALNCTIAHTQPSYGAFQGGKSLCFASIEIFLWPEQLVHEDYKSSP
ncbi:hypothetical protein O181_041622 [Austropuccinia psidii MF-1]|uniref:Uncharacterized protein n=1 Tax=Austropuccinia psidii MF-1 TaxID=1389203 RepID=A0A9Q3DH24_9BASI|nr:hypothetical protein [Austropuccinia psidii MF-1]